MALETLENVKEIGILQQVQNKMVQIQANGKNRWYKEGQPLPGGWELVKIIDEESVEVIDENGRPKTLKVSGG